MLVLKVDVELISMDIGLFNVFVVFLIKVFVVVVLFRFFWRSIDLFFVVCMWVWSFFVLLVEEL